MGGAFVPVAINGQQDVAKPVPHVLTIPRFGLGDILYSCVALSLLLRHRKIASAVVMAPPGSAELVKLFNIKFIPLYSKCLHLARPLGTNIVGELRFWSTLKTTKAECYFSLVNDLFDAALLEYFAGCNPLGHELGNYMQVRPGGIRGYINRIARFRWNKKPNPKHVAERALTALAPHCQLSPSLFYQHGRDVLAMRTKTLPAEKGGKWKVVVLPDAADPGRCLDAALIRRLLSRSNEPQSCLVVTRNIESKQLPTGVHVSNYPPLSDLWREIWQADTVIAADSFGVHFAAMAAPRRLIVMYPDSTPLNYYFEYWGIPLSNAVHVWRNSRLRVQTDSCLIVRFSSKYPL
jgi:ADP-heptose:LPS heptosyltransferase